MGCSEICSPFGTGPEIPSRALAGAGSLKHTDVSSSCSENRFFTFLCAVGVGLRAAFSRHFAAVIHVTFHFEKCHFLKTRP